MQETIVGGILSAKEIEAAMGRKEIIIDPFCPDQLEGTSYDLRMGYHIWVLEEIQSDSIVLLDNPNIWKGPIPAKTLSEWSRDAGLKIFKNNATAKAGFVLLPKQRALAYTREFIGSNSAKITAKIYSRSTATRWGIGVVEDAGVGDPGYYNRWTLELQNRNPFPVFISAGARIAQIVFMSVVNPSPIKYTHYQPADFSIEELKRKWKPEDMLPKSLL